MLEPIDNTELLNTAMNMSWLVDNLLQHLASVEKDTPAKVQTYEKIEAVINLQSKFIQELLEHHLKVTDALNQIIPQLKS